MQEQLVNILFKEPEQKGNKLQPGTMTLKDLYETGSSMVYVSNENGDMRFISRRDFHIIDPTKPKGGYRRAVVCDIDGVLNFIPKNVDGTSNRQNVETLDGQCQWTQLNATAEAIPRTVNFQMLADFAKRGFDILFLTARGDTQRVQTERFLREGFKSVKTDVDYILFMRGFSANDISAHDCKAQMMQACILPSYTVEFFIDDCPKNVNAIKEVCPNVPCIHFLP